MKKLIVCLALCLVFSFSALSEGIDLNSLSPEELQQLVNDASAALDEKSPASEYPRMSIDELFSEYSKNEASADLHYTNQLVEIVGEVNDIEKSGHSYRIDLGDGGIFSNYIMCYMKEDQLEKIAALEKEQTVIIRGECQGDPFLSRIHFENCEIIEE